MKNADKARLIEEKRNENLIRQERLDRAVEQYKDRPQIEADPDRIIAETETREIRKGVTMDDGDKVTLFKSQGFSCDKLMSDVRYKISSALHNAGLQSTTYGKEVLKGINNDFKP